MNTNITKSVAVIVAHPDDETLWAGGTILSRPSWNWFVVCLCRRSDKDRAPRFYNALKVLKSEGVMGDLDDGPEQKPLGKKKLELALLQLLPQKYFDLIISHNPAGEYTRNIRHEEVSRAVLKLWHAGKIAARELWIFAYEDGNKEYYPRPVINASVYRKLTKRIFLQKYSIMTQIYGFGKGTFEAETTPRAEAFWRLTDRDDAEKWLNHGGVVK